MPETQICKYYPPWFRRILDGIYQLTGMIRLQQAKVLRGCGARTVLVRDFVSSNKGSIVNLSTLSVLRDLSVDSSIDAPDAVQIECYAGCSVVNVNINARISVADGYGGKTVGAGIYVRNGTQGTLISGCRFEHVQTAVLISANAGGTTVSECFVSGIEIPYFVRSEENAYNGILIIGNRTKNSTISLDVRGSGTIIANNVIQKIEISNTAGNIGSQVGGNLIANNCFEGLVGQSTASGIILGENTSGWFVTGNQVRNTTVENGYWRIVDNGVKNDVRFNSNDQGGSTPATVQQATPTITVNGEGTVTARATQAAGYVAVGTRSATYQISSADDADLTPDNIKEGVSIFGVTGNLKSGGGAGGVTSSNGSVADIQAVTQAEYDALTTKNPTTLYLIKE